SLLITYRASCALPHVCICNFSGEPLQTFVGLTALLAAFPPCLGTGHVNDDQPTHALLSGSVCKVRDSLDFLD
ncbi:unnamed protein product, partial [Laminaria digitata]